MPLFMDVHRNIDSIDTQAARDAHEMDLEIQGEYDVEYAKYWVDEDSGAVFCLFEAPNREAGEAVHRESHGLVADEIYEVQEGS